MKTPNGLLFSTLLAFSLVLAGCGSKPEPSSVVSTSSESTSSSSDKHDLSSKRIVDIFGEQDAERFEQMFQKGEFDFEYRSFRGASVLHYAAMRGDVNRDKELLDHGADVKAKDEQGATALHYAANDGNLELVQWLVEQGLDVNAKDNNGKSVLQYAIENEDQLLVEWLKDHGAK